MEVKDFYCPCEGKIIRIEEFPDEIIADKLMGDGFGVYIEKNEIVSPFDGVVNVVYPTGHAICLTSNDGIKIIIHIGIDSYKISGLNKLYVKVNDKVKKGDLLIKTDVRKLNKLTGNTATAVVFLDEQEIVGLKAGQYIVKLDKVCQIRT